MGDSSRIVRSAFGFVAVLFLLNSCSSGSTDDEVAGAGDTTEASDSDDGVEFDDATSTTTPTFDPDDFEEPDPPVLTVIDPGEEPRQELRFVLEDGTEVSSTTSTQIIEQLVDGEAIVPPQPIETITETSITRTVVDGGVEVVFEITDVALGDATDPELADFISANFAELIGISTTLLVDDRGFVVRASAEAGANELVDDLLGEAFNQSNQLPAEPIGVGGAWVIESAAEDDGLTVLMQTILTVREFTEGGVVLNVEVVQDVAEVGEEINLDGVPAVVDVWDVAGDGTLEISFGQFSPIASDLVVDGAQGFTFPGAGSLEQRISSETLVETIG